MKGWSAKREIAQLLAQHCMLTLDAAERLVEQHAKEVLAECAPQHTQGLGVISYPSGMRCTVKVVDGVTHIDIGERE